jgi:hypothetical protein
MGWSGRAPTLPESSLRRGTLDGGARHVREGRFRDRGRRIDIGKTSFHIIGLDHRGAAVLGRGGRAAT